MKFTPENIELNPLSIATVASGLLSIWQPTVKGTIYVGLGIEGNLEARLSRTEAADLEALVARIVERVEREAKARSLADITSEEVDRG